MTLKIVVKGIAWLIAIAAVLYLAACVVLYEKQESLLFPSDIPPPMPSNWRSSEPYPSEEMKLASPRGVLHGVLWHAPHAKGTVLYSHGNAENIGVLQQVAPQFIEHGYNLMVWDYRGYGLSTGKLGGQAALLADAEDVYNWLILREDANKIVFYGRSLGSGVAVYLASKHPGHKVMLESAYDSLLAVGQDHNRIFPLRLLKYPMPAALWVSGVSAPIYIIHGTSDHIIPVKHAIALAKAAPNATVTLIEGAGHNGLSHEPEYADWLSKGLE